MGGALAPGKKNPQAWGSRGRAGGKGAAPNGMAGRLARLRAGGRWPPIVSNRKSIDLQCDKQLNVGWGREERWRGECLDWVGKGPHAWAAGWGGGSKEGGGWRGRGGAADEPPPPPEGGPSREVDHDESHSFSGEQAEERRVGFGCVGGGGCGAEVRLLLIQNCREGEGAWPGPRIGRIGGWGGGGGGGPGARGMLLQGERRRSQGGWVGAGEGARGRVQRGVLLRVGCAGGSTKTWGDKKQGWDGGRARRQRWPPGGAMRAKRQGRNTGVDDTGGTRWGL